MRDKDISKKLASVRSYLDTFTLVGFFYVGRWDNGSWKNTTWREYFQATAFVQTHPASFSYSI